MRITFIGGPTALLEVGGLTLLTDPAFGDPGEYPSGSRTLRKTSSPAIRSDDLPRIDAVLLSHDQHVDNLDALGRELLPRAGTVLTTPAAAERLGGNAVGVAPWRHHELDRPGGGSLRVVAVPAQHGPDGTEHITGPVTGFVLSGTGLPTVYVGGDNASLRVVDDVVRHTAADIDVAVLNAGGARTALLDAYLTFTSRQAAEAAALIGAPRVAVLHTEGWGHFTTDQASVRAAFDAAGMGGRLIDLEAGPAVQAWP
ncbi:MBL fold metallo-hydrolase [Leifsonia sp. 22587]|uniref:MBL fold metallo-hydrolase n=1 Tax=Leifsonia sp. 22587 TaxID=3453946 RepID=UPI003F82A04E